MERVIIIGSGPAAHTAAIYTARSELKPLVFEGFMAGGVAAGGQLTTTTSVENYPGFPAAIGGTELMDRMRSQSLTYGARILTETVEAVNLSSWPFTVRSSSGEYTCETLIIATGATARRLNIPGEDRYWQRGISSCAVCDGALPIFRNGVLFLVGGGDVACEEALFLTNFSSSVYMLVRRDVFRASRIMQKRVLEKKEITVMWNTEAVEARGDTVLTHVLVKNNTTNKEKLLAAQGLFYAIGHIPNTAFLEGQLETDSSAYIITAPGTVRTNVEGVFACGDVQDKIYRQAITAAGSGCMAALEAERFLAARETE